MDATGRRIAVTVVYPETYPYLRPEVYVPSLRLDRHQNPYGGNLCLLDRSTRFWRTSDTAAWLVADRVPFLLELLDAGGQRLRDAEAPQGEPVTAFFPFAAGTAVFIPPPFLALPRDARSGSAVLRTSADQRPGQLRALLARARRLNETGIPVVIADVPNSGELTRFDGPEISVRWVRPDQPPSDNSAEGVIAAAERVDREAAEPHWQPFGEIDISVMGVILDVEVEQGVWEDEWLFAVRTRHRHGDRGKQYSYVTRGERFSRDALRARIPDLRALDQKTVALFGLGALGAPIALELSRALLGELRILDFDSVELGTTVRWPYGLSAVSFQKTAFVRAIIEREYPFTRCVAYEGQIGSTAPLGPNGVTDFKAVCEMLEGADLLIDATAELGLQHLFSDLARERNLAQVYVWATEGAWSGAVAHIVPGATGCWSCMQHHFETNELPYPRGSPTGTVQPAGCATTTFTGANFDLLPLVAQASRVASRALTSSPVTGDLHVVELESGSGVQPAPRWSTHWITTHPECRDCQGD
jgi:molybdopterin/thiamine biosynthesis adenylyltransferase